MDEEGSRGGASVMVTVAEDMFDIVAVSIVLEEVRDVGGERSDKVRAFAAKGLLGFWRRLRGVAWLPNAPAGTDWERCRSS